MKRCLNVFHEAWFYLGLIIAVLRLGILGSVLSASLECGVCQILPSVLMYILMWISGVSSVNLHPFLMTLNGAAGALTGNQDC